MTGTPPAAPETPYVGLLPYGEDDADFFFGRDEERWIVAGNLRADRLTILYGPSGVGKTSLLQAGVVPDLRDQQPVASAFSQQRARKPVAVCTFRTWQDEPLPALMTALRVAASEALGGSDLRPWERGDSVVEALQAWTEQLQTVLVVLDQFEDYFLYHDEETDAGTFGHEFPALVNEPSLRVNFLVSIREDAWAKLDRFEGRIPRLFANYLRVGHLSLPAARDAIEGPIEEWNRRLPRDEQPYTVEGALVEAVVEAAASGGLALTESGAAANPAETRTSEVEAPFLQLVMERLWRAAVDAGTRDLTLAMLEQLGGAQRIVENHLRVALGALTPREQSIAADVFRFLVTRSRTKIAHQSSDLAEWTGHPEPEVTATLEKLCRGESGRVLRPVTPPAGAGGVTRYELFHDVLAGPILEWRREYEQARARRAALRRFARIGAVLVSLTAVFAALGLWALVQRNDAKRATRSAVSLALAAAADRQLADRPDEALLLSLEAYRSSPSAEATGSMIKALESARRSDAEAILHADREGARDVAFSPDGRTVASGGFDGTLRLWDVAARRSLGTLGPPNPAHAGEIWSVAFSPDGATLASAGFDGKVRLWDVRERTPLPGPPDVATERMTAVAFSGDGRILAFAGQDGLIRLWDLRTQRPVGRPLRGHSDRVVSIAFSPDGSMLASASFDSTVRLWRLQGRGRTSRVLRGHVNEAVSVAFSPDGRTLASSGVDGTVRLWDGQDGRTLGQLLPGGPGEVWSVAFSPDGRTLASGGPGRTVRLWAIRPGTPGGARAFEPQPPLRGHTDRVVIVAFGPDGRTLASSSYDGTVRLWDVRKRSSPVQALSGHTDSVKSLAFSPDGQTLASAGDDGTPRLWNVGAPKPSGRRLEGQTGALESAAFSPDGSTLATAGHDRPVQLWDVDSGRVERTLQPAEGAVLSVAFSPDGGTLASAGSDGTVWLWEAESGRQLGPPLRGHTGPVSSVAFSPDGRTLASASFEDGIRLWDVRGRTPITTLAGGGDPLSVAFSPDGSTLAAGGVGGSVRLWDLRAKPPRAQPLHGHSPTKNVVSVAFSPDGGILASGSEDGTVRLWDVRGRKQLGPPLRGGTEAVFSVAFSPDGHTLASAGLDGTVRLWTGFLWRDVSDLRNQVCGLVVGNLSKAEWDVLAPGVAYSTTCPG